MTQIRAFIKALFFVGLIAVAMNLVHHFWPIAKLESMYLGMAFYTTFMWFLIEEKNKWY